MIAYDFQTFGITEVPEGKECPFEGFSVKPFFYYIAGRYWNKKKPSKLTMTLPQIIAKLQKTNHLKKVVQK